MKKILIVLVLLLVTSALFAQEYGNFGFGVNISYFKDKYTDSSGTVGDEDTSFSMGANVSIMVADSVELRPFLYFGTDKTENGGTQIDGETYVGVGFGAFWHILRSTYIRMGPGAVIQGDYWFDTYPSTADGGGLNIKLKIPLMTEFVMTKNVVFRLEYNMFIFETIADIYGNDDEYTQYDVDFFPVGSGAVSLGVNFRF